MTTNIGYYLIQMENDLVMSAYGPYLSPRVVREKRDLLLDLGQLTRSEKMVFVTNHFNRIPESVIQTLIDENKIVLEEIPETTRKNFKSYNEGQRS